MKRIFVLLLAAWMALGSFAACGAQPAVSTQPSAETTLPVPAQTAPAETEPLQTVPQQTEPVLPAAPIAISEVMPDNRHLVLGHGLDWVELYNPGEDAVSLEGYSLTEDPQNPDAMALDGLQIPGGGYLTVVLEDSAPIRLSEMGGSISLTYSGETVDRMTFPKVEKGESFDEQGACQFPTPGYANTEEGFRSYMQGQSLPELLISEAMPANGSYYHRGTYEYIDWVEIRNTTAAPLDLGDYYLTDRWEDNNRYFFPELELAPGENYMLLCSGDPSRGENHTPFSINPGDTLYLAKNGHFIDCLPLPEDLKTDESYGRSGSLPCYQAEPTPDEANGEGYLTGIAQPQASVTPGLYDQPVTVALSGPGTIYYTLSGARPSTSSMVYREPITIDGVTTIRAICVENGRKSAVADLTYVVGKEHDLPVLVISIPDDSLWGSTGIFTDVEAVREREAVMTLFENGEQAFTIPMGFRLHGNDSRFGAKKNFQLRFRSEYGAGKLEYPLFESRDIDEFDSLLLKGGSEDWANAMIRDELATSLADGVSNLYTQAMKPVVVYLAGNYWGVHHLRERFSDEYVASHMGVSPESVDILYSSDGYVQVGNGSDFYSIKSFVLNNDMRKPENYAYLCEKIDVTSLIDWYVFRTYLEDTDIANIRRCRSSEGDGKWHWMFFDLDWSFYSRDGAPVSGILEMYGGDRLLIQAVLDSEAGRDAFLRRYAYLMDTVLNEQSILNRIDALIAPFASEMERDRDRWNRSVETWEYYLGLVREFVIGRDEVVLYDIQQYFRLSDQQMEAYFGEKFE